MGCRRCVRAAAWPMPPSASGSPDPRRGKRRLSTELQRRSNRYDLLVQGAVTVHMEAPALEILDDRRRRTEHRAILTGDLRRRMARRSYRTRRRCSVPWSRQAERDRAGLLDNLPGDRVRTRSRVRFRRAARRPHGEHLALQIHPERRWDRRDRVVQGPRSGCAAGDVILRVSAQAPQHARHANHT
jgi:hypothetical protein